MRLEEEVEAAEAKKGSFLPPDRLPMAAAAAAAGNGSGRRRLLSEVVGWRGAAREDGGRVLQLRSGLGWDYIGRWYSRLARTVIFTRHKPDS